MSLNIVSDGMGSYGYSFMKPFFKRVFPHTDITYDNTKNADLVVRSHFTGAERANPYTCPYITWSGESRRVNVLNGHDPLFEINTHYTNMPNSVYFPHLIAEIQVTKRPETITKKKYCCSYAFSNRIRERETLFKTMRSLEPSCYSFGRSCPTNDTPFIAPIEIRGNNAEFFKEFGFNVAMENAVIPGYMTEKIGFAFNSGSVPIYWGDTETVNSFFNSESFINVRNYASAEAAGEASVEICRDPQKYQKYLDAPIVLNDRLSNYEAIYMEYRPWQKQMVDILHETFPEHS